jgi:nucleotide-binding universal stress UspA family protein
MIDPDKFPVEPMIVVGVDGSEDSKEALRWAVEEARVRGGVVRVVLAWQVPTMALIGPYVVPDLHASTRRAAEATVAAAVACADNSGGVRVTSEAVEGVPTRVLELASAKADMLVLGSRGHGKVSRIILGSVSRHMTTHAHCPVVVVRHQRCA